MMIEREPSIWEYMTMPLRKYADFKGRARRKEFWLWTLLVVVCSFGFGLFSFILADLSAGNKNEIAYSVALTIIGLIYMAIIIPGLAVTVRRLHDTGRSGWWILIYLVPTVGGIILLIFCMLESEVGPNKWGASPKEPQDMSLEDHLIVD